MKVMRNMEEKERDGVLGMCPAATAWKNSEMAEKLGKRVAKQRAVLFQKEKTAVHDGAILQDVDGPSRGQARKRKKHAGVIKEVLTRRKPRVRPWRTL